MSDNPKPIIGISIGDVNGIGTELLIRTFTNQRMLQICVPVFYGSSKVLNFYRKLLKVEQLSYHQVSMDAMEGSNFKWHTKKLNVVNCWDDEITLTPGKADLEVGKYAFLALEKATQDAIDGKIDGMVTLPINKEVIQQEEFNFPGHTEYLEKKSGSKQSLMFMTTDFLKIGVVTGHIPLTEVKGSLSIESIQTKAKTLIKSLKKDFGIKKPRLAVLGLNPHAGENGLLGNEENELINPTLKGLKDAGNLVFGPFPADGFFGSGAFKQYDGVLAMYHDQGLIPFKALSFQEGVNFTAGLPIVRTSPDHGTAYDLVGKNKASNGSFLQALYTCVDVVKNRGVD